MLANKKIKDDTTSITNLSELLSEKINGKILNHHVEPLMQFGENFGSEILRVIVTIEDPNGNQRVVNAVAKLLPSTELQRELFSVQSTFKCEIGFYADIVPTLKEFQEECNVEPLMDYFPELYGARTSLVPHSEVVDENAVIMLENLGQRGFHNLDRCEGFDLDSTKKVLKSLARFQATTLALRKKKPDTFEAKVKPYLKEPRPLPPFNYNHILKENPKTTALVGTINKLINKSQKTIVREPWATITHNDFWVNNIMVTNKADGTIDKIKLIDFQMPDYSSPVRDVIFFLFSSVSLPVLKYHLDKLFQYYFTEFVAVLKQFQEDSKEFTYESFREELRLEGGLQVHHSLFMVPIILAPKQEKPESPNMTALSHEGQYFTSAMKEKIWYIVEEAAKRSWI